MSSQWAHPFNDRAIKEEIRENNRRREMRADAEKERLERVRKEATFTSVICYSKGKEVFNGFAKKGVTQKQDHVEFIDVDTGLKTKISGDAFVVTAPKKQLKK